MEQDMDNWREELVAIKARLAVQQLALRALVHSHPDPAAVLAEWRELMADSITAAYAPAADASSCEWLTLQVQALAEEWTTELSTASARGGNGAATDTTGAETVAAG
jgi:hypothetical protein